jgi:hypothetical protein
MMKEWEKNFKKQEDQHAQLYLRAYVNQKRRHKLIVVMHILFSLLAAVVPPLSLFLTIPVLILTVQKHEPIASIIASVIIGAFVPIFSGILCGPLGLGARLEDRRLSKDKIQRVIIPKTEFELENEILKEIKEQMFQLDNDFNFQNLKVNDEDKINKKVTIGFTNLKKKKMLAIYMDSEQKARRENLFECRIHLPEREKGRKPRQLSEAEMDKLKDSFKFFKAASDRSVKIVEGLEIQYGYRKGKVA